MRKKLKGFTLVELIIVLAIFSLIMFSAVRLLDPVSKFFVRGTNFESTNACLDNMKRAIEGNLKYANRVHLYRGFEPYDTSASDYKLDDDAHKLSFTSNYYDNVKKFYNDFFYDRKCVESYGEFYVLIFDNKGGSLNYNNPTDYADHTENGGMVTLVTYKMPQDNNNSPSTRTWDVVKATEKVDKWYVNKALYGNFDYRFEMTTDSTHLGSPTGFNPADFSMTIKQFEIRKDYTQDNMLMRVTETSEGEKEYSTYGSTICSFAMNNVLDGVNIGRDFKITNCRGDGTYCTLSANDGILRSSTFANTASDAFDGFYFIFTNPETIYNDVTGLESIGETTPATPPTPGT